MSQARVSHRLVASSSLLVLMVLAGLGVAHASTAIVQASTARTIYDYDGAISNAQTHRVAEPPTTAAPRDHPTRVSGQERVIPFSADLVVATEAESAGLSEAFHYTGSQNVASIEANGLRAGSYATPDGELSPLQAQIDLALPPNRGLPGARLRIDVAGLREAGYDIPEVTQVGRSYNMPGGGYEMRFPYPIPPEFIKAVP